MRIKIAASVALLTVPLSAQFLPRVALCGAATTQSTDCRWTAVQSALLSTGMFSGCDILNTTTRALGTPTLGDLAPYDALLVWTNAPPDDNNALGDVLADYVDHGGGVVVAVYANSTTSTTRFLGGRWQNGYEVIQDQGGNTTTTGRSLGNVAVPGHPVMNGVTQFQGVARPTGTALEPGASLIASWTDGKVLAAQGANPRRIDLGFYPPPASCTSLGWSVGGDLLMANALRFVADGAFFGPYGTGCAGSTGVPILDGAPGTRPVLGSTMQLEATNVAYGVGFISLGISDTMSGSLTLPYDLTAIGMPGCELLADPLSVAMAAGGPPTVTLSLSLPMSTAMIGASFYGQAFSVDSAANPIGVAVSNGLRVKLGQ